MFLFISHWPCGEKSHRLLKRSIYLPYLWERTEVAGSLGQMLCWGYVLYLVFACALTWSAAVLFQFSLLFFWGKKINCCIPAQGERKRDSFILCLSRGERFPVAYQHCKQSSKHSPSGHTLGSIMSLNVVSRFPTLRVNVCLVSVKAYKASHSYTLPPT